MKSKLAKRRMAVVLTLCLVMGGQTPVQAQGLIERIKNLFGGGDRGDRGRGRGGGTLDLCPYVEDDLWAFAPVGAATTATAPDLAEQPESESVLMPTVGATIQRQPTLWFYVPYGAAANRPVEFVLIDSNETILTRQPLALPENPGVMPVPLPDEVILAAGQRYRWVFSIICNPANRSADLTVNGWIERVPSQEDIETAIAVTPAANLPLFYAENDLWYDTVDALARLRIANPDGAALAADWLALLEIVGLEGTAIEQGAMPISPSSSPATPLVE